MNNERGININLLITLVFFTVVASLLWGTVYFITGDNPVPGITGIICFLGFLGLMVMGLIHVGIVQLRYIRDYVEAGVQRFIIKDMLGRPNPGQIDRVLTCECDKCLELRQRFNLPDRTGMPSLLTPDEESEEADILEN